VRVYDVTTDAYAVGDRGRARLLPAFTEYPNEQVEYGALCIAQSIPK